MLFDMILCPTNELEHATTKIVNNYHFAVSEPMIFLNIYKAHHVFKRSMVKIAYYHTGIVISQVPDELFHK